MTSFQPFDLQPPARLLYPGPGHDRVTGATRSAQLGGQQGPVLTVRSWGDCRPSCRGANGEHKPGRTICLTVPCDALPHCIACECGSEHMFYLDEDTAAQIRDLLG